RVVAPPNEIEVFNKYVKVAHMTLEWEDGKGVVEQYSELMWDLPFRKLGNGGHKISTDDVIEFFRERCFPETRADKDRVLQSLGLSMYSPMGIIKRTHGILFDDYIWIRF